MLGRPTVLCWDPVVKRDTMQECKDFVKKGGLLCPKGTPLVFRWNQARPGNGKTSVYMVCRSHEACPVELHLSKIGGDFWVQTLAGVDHTTEKILKGRRSNSAMTDTQYEELRMAVDMGGKPAAVVASWTKSELDRCKVAGTTAEKRPIGGLTGVFKLANMEYTIIHNKYIHNTSTIHVQYMHNTCTIHL